MNALEEYDRVFDAYGKYYDALYAEKDYAAEAEYISKLIGTYGRNCRELLEFGSGTGKHGRLLAKMGYRVEGIERSAAMLAQLEQAEGFQCHLGDARSISMGRDFDAVLALFHVLNYQVRDVDAQAFFDNAALHLEPGGLFVFDTWYSPAVLAQQPETRIKHISNSGLDLTRTATPLIRAGTSRVDVEYALQIKKYPQEEIESFVEIHAMRHFSLPELDLLSKASGFERLAAEEFLSGELPSKNTWSVTVVLRKI